MEDGTDFVFSLVEGRAKFLKLLPSEKENDSFSTSKLKWVRHSSCTIYFDLIRERWDPLSPKP